MTKGRCPWHAGGFASSKLLKTSALFLVLVVYMFFVSTVYKQYRADVHFERSQNLLKRSDVVQAFKEVNKSIELNSKEPAYYRGRAKVLLTSTYGEKEENTRFLKSFALADLDKAYSLNPKNLATIRNLVPLYYFLSIKDLSHPPDENNIDAEFLKYAVEYYSKTNNISLNDAGIYTLYAKYYKKLNMTEEYNKNAARVKELRPDLLEWHEAFR